MFRIWFGTPLSRLSLSRMDLYEMRGRLQVITEETTASEEEENEEEFVLVSNRKSSPDPDDPPDAFCGDCEVPVHSGMRGHAHHRVTPLTATTQDLKVCVVCVSVKVLESHHCHVAAVGSLTEALNP